MSNLVKEFLELRTTATNTIRTIRETVDSARLAAEDAELPKRLRPAVAADIVEGAVLWYPDWVTPGTVDYDPDGRCWNIVDEVLRPGDAFKAYEAHDGCRYGLDGAYVELTS